MDWGVTSMSQAQVEKEKKEEYEKQKPTTLSSEDEELFSNLGEDNIKKLEEMNQAFKVDDSLETPLFIYSIISSFIKTIPIINLCENILINCLLIRFKYSDIKEQLLMLYRLMNEYKKSILNILIVLNDPNIQNIFKENTDQEDKLKNLKILILNLQNIIENEIYKYITKIFYQSSLDEKELQLREEKRAADNKISFQSRVYNFTSKSLTEEKYFRGKLEGIPKKITNFKIFYSFFRAPDDISRHLTELENNLKSYIILILLNTTELSLLINKSTNTHIGGKKQFGGDKYEEYYKNFNEWFHNWVNTNKYMDDEKDKLIKEIQDKLTDETTKIEETKKTYDEIVLNGIDVNPLELPDRESFSSKLRESILDDKKEGGNRRRKTNKRKINKRKTNKKK